MHTDTHNPTTAEIAALYARQERRDDLGELLAVAPFDVLEAAAAEGMELVGYPEDGGATIRLYFGAEVFVITHAARPQLSTAVRRALSDMCASIADHCEAQNLDPAGVRVAAVAAMVYAPDLETLKTRLERTFALYRGLRDRDHDAWPPYHLIPAYSANHPTLRREYLRISAQALSIWSWDQERLLIMNTDGALEIVTAPAFTE